MKSEEFEAGNWIERLARALQRLSQAQGPFLRDYGRYNPRNSVMVDGQDETPFPLDDLRTIYLFARHGRMVGEREYYAPLRAAMDPVLTLLLSHPTLWRVVGPLIDNDEFWVSMLGHGSLTSLTNVIGGLMARADELSGYGFDAAAGELHALLESPRRGHANAVTGGLVTGYHVVLFHGLCLEADINIGGGLSMLPFERVRAFVDEEVLKDMAPDVVRFQDWRLVGAVVMPFQWRPVLRRRGDLQHTEAEPPEFFARDALEFFRTAGGVTPGADRVSGGGTGVSQPIRLPAARTGAQLRRGAMGPSSPSFQFVCHIPQASDRGAYGSEDGLRTKERARITGSFRQLWHVSPKRLPGTVGSRRKTGSWTSPSAGADV